MLSKKALAVSPSPTLAIDGKAKEMIRQGLDVIGFGAGEPDFDTPLHIKEAAIKAIHEGHTRYTPASGTIELKEAVCYRIKTDQGLEYSPDQIVISNGAKHSLFNALAALLNPGDEVLIPVPYWVSNPELVKLNDGVPVAVETRRDNCLKATVEDLEKYRTTRTKVLLLNSPTNPTGQVYSAEEMKALADYCCEHNLYVIGDEIYEKLTYDNARHYSIASFNDKIKELTIVINGLSKSYAMTGWRIGYTASTTEIARVMNTIQGQITSGPNSIAQRAAVTALQGSQECVEEMRLAFDQRRRHMCEQVNNIPCLEALVPRGTFYLFIDVSGALGRSYEGQKIENGDDFARHLLESKKVAIVPGSGFGAPNYVRMSFATSMEHIAEGLQRMEAFVNELV